jgi:hypothetical protein
MGAMETMNQVYTLYYTVSGILIQKMEFTVGAPGESTMISAWKWEMGSCNWTPCFKNKTLSWGEDSGLWFHQKIGVSVELAREIWNHYRKEGWAR